MKILVLGGTRFFGKHLVQMLINDKHEVHLFNRGLSPDDFGNLVTRHIGDRQKKQDLEKVSLKHHFDAVFDQICMTADEAQIAVDAFQNRTKHLIFTSTLSVYEWGAGLKETDLDALNCSPKIPQSPSEVYQVGKREAERVYLSQDKIPISIMRIPIVTGTDDYTLRLKRQIDRIAQGLPTHYINLDAKFSLVQAIDAARALKWMMDENKMGVFNIASPGEISGYEFVQLIESIVGKKAIKTDVQSEENRSSVVVPFDWYMNVDKAQAAGFKIQPLISWLPGLIKALHNPQSTFSSHQ